MLDPNACAFAHFRHKRTGLLSSATLTMTGPLEWMVLIVSNDDAGNVSFAVGEPSLDYNRSLLARTYHWQQETDRLLNSANALEREAASAMALFMTECLILPLGDKLMDCSADETQSRQFALLLDASIDAVMRGSPPLDEVVVFATALRGAGCCTPAIAA